MTGMLSPGASVARESAPVNDIARSNGAANTFGVPIDLPNGMIGFFDPLSGSVTVPGEAVGLPGAMVEVNPATGQATATISSLAGPITMDLDAAQGLFGGGQGVIGGPGATGPVLDLGEDIALDPTSPEGIEKGLQDMGHGRGFNGIEGTMTAQERAQALGLGTGRSNLGGAVPGDDEDGVQASGVPTSQLGVGYGQSMDPVVGGDEDPAAMGANAFAAPENAPSYGGGSYANEMESANSGFIGEIGQGGPNAGAAREGIGNAISGFNGVISGLESRAADLESEIAADQGLVSGLEGMMDAMGTAAAGRGSDREGARGQGFGNIGTSEDVGNAFAMDGLENGPGLAGSFGGGDVGSDMAAASAGLDLGDRSGGFARDLTGFTPGFSDDGANNGISTASMGVSDLDMTGGDSRDMAMDGATGGAGLGNATGFGVDISGGMSGLDNDLSSGSDREADRGAGFGGIGENAFDGASNDMSSGLEGSSSANASGGGGRDFGGRDKDLSSDDMSGGWGWGGMGGSSGGGWASDAFGGFDRGADLGIGMDSDNAWG